MAEDFTQCLPYMMRIVGQVLFQQAERTLRLHDLTNAQLERNVFFDRTTPART